MTTHDETPPQPGLTREDTGCLFGHPFIGWRLTPEFHAEVMRRVDQRQGGDATTETAPHLSRRAVHPDTAPTSASKPRRYKPKRCGHCGETFAPTINNAVYCGPECARLEKQARYRQTRRQRREAA